MWPKIKLIQAFIHVLVTCKNEEESFKNEGAYMYMWIFPDAQGQFTPQSSVGPARNSKYYTRLLWLYFLPAKMKKIQ